MRDPIADKLLCHGLHTPLKKVKELADDIRYLDRREETHEDHCYEFLMRAAKRQAERNRTADQRAEYMKALKGPSQQTALVAKKSKAEKKAAAKAAAAQAAAAASLGKGGKFQKAPCWKFQTGSCPHSGAECSLQHVMKGKGKGKGDKKTKAQNDSPAAPAAQPPVSQTQPTQTAAAADAKATGKKPCHFFNTAKGCTKGDKCTYLHISLAKALVAAATLMAVVNGMFMCPTTVANVSDDFVLVLSTAQFRHGIIFQSHMMPGRLRRRLEARIGSGTDVLELLATNMSGGGGLPL